MNPYLTTPEYILEESEKIVPMEKVPVSLGRDFLQVEADLAQLYLELSTLVDTSRKIRDSVLDLEQSLVDSQLRGS